MHPPQTVATVTQTSTTLLSAEVLFTLFGMVLTLGGLVGGRRVKIISLEFGPIESKWRRIAMVAIGLIILTCIGILNMQ